MTNAQRLGSDSCSSVTPPMFAGFHSFPVCYVAATEYCCGLKGSREGEQGVPARDLLCATVGAFGYGSMARQSTVTVLRIAPAIAPRLW